MLTGYVVDFADQSELEEEKLKGIEDVLDEGPLVDDEILKLTKWIAQYYLCSWGEAIQAAIPAGIRIKSYRVVRLNTDNPSDVISFLESKAPRRAKVLRILEENREIELNKLVEQIEARDIYPSLRALQEKDLIRIETRLGDEGVKVKYKDIVKLAKDPEEIENEIKSLKRADKQIKILRLLLANPGGYFKSELLELADTSPSPLKALEEKGLISLEKIEVKRNPFIDGIFMEKDQHFELTEAQNKAEQLIEEGLRDENSRVILLQGVTGSGKTEVYLRAIAKVLEQGKQAIVLVPEISLTPQMIGRFRSRFGEQIAILHSQLSIGERYDQWRRLKEGEADIAIGARSAIFAPLKRLGLIVIDEEHETSYKQDTVPRYHAREVAVKRAELSGAVVILGGATPSLESRFSAGQGRYDFAILPERIEARPLPAVEIVDMREELKQGNRSIFSRRLAQSLNRCLEEKEQAILFLNRRGYAPFILCRDCGYVPRCPHCQVSLTYHFTDKDLRCHHCGYSRQAPDICPRCKSRYIRHFGIGTQRVEEELKKQFPQGRVLRLDADTTTRKGAHSSMLGSFKKREIDILVGTQMIAKGLDFPEVTTVGVITADTSLNLPDFRAAERTFQLLTQVAGRAGRGSKLGEVIIQTYAPEHYSILAARTHDYETFYEQEMKLREELLYPPFSHFVNLLLTHPQEKAVIEAAGRMKLFLSEAREELERDDIEILGPTQAPLAKLKNRYRWLITLKGERVEDMNDLIRSSLKRIGSSLGRVKLEIDVDPLGMM